MRFLVPVLLVVMVPVVVVTVGFDGSDLAIERASRRTRQMTSTKALDWKDSIVDREQKRMWRATVRCFGMNRSIIGRNLFIELIDI